MQIQFYPRSGIDASNLKLGIKFLSRFENRVIGNSRASVVSRLFIFLLFFSLYREIKVKPRVEERREKKSWINRRF